MKYLKLFESFEDIDSIALIRCEKYGIENYTINEDGSVDINGNVYLYSKGLTELPLRFRNVSGFFQCRVNELTSLYGCPESVGGYFDCEHNKIRTFEILPKHIGGDFDCFGNPIWYLWRLFKDKDKVELFNDFGITDGEVVILERLNDFLEMIGKPKVTDQCVWLHGIRDLEEEGYKVI